MKSKRKELKMEFKDVLEKRRTIRFYKQEKVESDLLRKLMEAARLAPCGGNMQRLRYIIVSEDQETVRRVFEQTAWAAFVKPKRSPEWGKNAPLAFIVLTSAKADSDTVHADAGAAVQNMQLAATDLGLGCCWIGSFNRAETAKILKLPDGAAAVYLVAVGWPAEAYPVSEAAVEGDSIKYYLDDDDRLHVPKLTVESLCKWM
jgi:nitroreductase